MGKAADLSTSLRFGRDDKSVSTDSFMTLGWLASP
jgi:hypothetical protein